MSKYEYEYDESVYYQFIIQLPKVFA